MRGKPRLRMQSPAPEAQQKGAAGWSSPVARQAHNLKVVGSNPTPATTAVTPTPHPPTAERPALTKRGCQHARTQAWRPVRPSGNAARGNSYARSRPCLAGGGIVGVWQPLGAALRASVRRVCAAFARRCRAIAAWSCNVPPRRDRQPVDRRVVRSQRRSGPRLRG